MLFKKREPYLEVGTITAKLGMRRFYIGERRWEWIRCRERFLFRPAYGLNPHACIIGTSGSGKSNACKLLARSASLQGAKLSILDPHGEYASIAKEIGAEIYDASRSSINVFELDGMSEREKTGELLSMFRRTFKIGEVQGYTLYKCLLYTYRICAEKKSVPNIKSLLFTIKVFRNNADIKEQRILESLEKRLSLLDTGYSKSCITERILSQNSVIVLSNLHTPEAQSVYIEGFLRKVYTNMLSMRKSRTPRFYAIIDEAAKVQGSDVLARISAEGRKYGFGIIALSQRAKEMDRSLRSNSAIFASFYQREPEELNYIANFIAGGNEGSRFVEVKKALRNLGRGSAILTDSSKKEPVIVRFDLYKEQGESAVPAVMQMCHGVARKEELLKRMQSMGYGLRESETGIEEATAGKLIHRFMLRDCGAYSGEWYLKDIRNTAEHDISVHAISRRLSDSGIQNRIYNSSNGPDIIACSGTVAIEYETGLKTKQATESMILARKKAYKKVLIIANNESKQMYSGICNVVSIQEFMLMGKESALAYITC